MPTFSAKVRLWPGVTLNELVADLADQLELQADAADVDISEDLAVVRALVDGPFPPAGSRAPDTTADALSEQLDAWVRDCRMAVEFGDWPDLYRA